MSGSESTTQRTTHRTITVPRETSSPVGAGPTPYGGSMAEVAVRCEVVIPCRDEAPALPALLAKLPAGFHAIVVDNGSRDATAEVARELGATVVSEPQPGYGAAVHAGLEAATAEFVAVLDGDGSMDPAELVPLLAEVTAGRADLAVGRRRPSARGVWPWHARAGNALVLWWLRRRIAMPLHDIAPMRVGRREALLGLGIEDRRFGYPVELLQRATSAGWRFVERDISYYPRAAGTRSKVSGSVRGTLRAARDFARVLS
jgi:glycosyltransferase involved in cell wall biosynthesis